MSLHVHCHISGGHFLLDLFARLRYFIFCKELPVNHPELQEASVWVYFHSSVPEFNKVECWGPLSDAAAPYRSRPGGALEDNEKETSPSNRDLPEPCQEECNCCFPPLSLVPWPQELPHVNETRYGPQQSFDGQTQETN
ncbi:hypothetical protein Pyn_21695 [Prunus yedoensis var. nudiflora]|uniref:Staygreen protein domain-containing protein n=1 Tax=Prunus yedoensis var. nudiflora TaxID=2094558 RepID=A0A314UVH3_PRUYE|nr:hypothetical protein Pyn_21695 [Prunus yedoensis var. nudiflora]